MPKKVFFSFHYDADNWRVSQVRNIGAIEGNLAVTDNDWESVKRGGDEAIKRWINGQIDGRSCGIVLIGANTAGRKWIDHEILECWNKGKGLLGIHVHNLKDAARNQTSKGTNPFVGFTIRNGTTSLSTIIPVYDPPFWDSAAAYQHIARNIAGWVDDAIAVRARYN